jgi:[ribosomal protein S5]-alanine N-acetyltransferase
MRLIPLSEAGRPTEPLPDLPKEALEVGDAYVGLYKSVGYQPPWLGYLAMMNDVCVGSCGFKSPPKDGRVEIAYFTFPAHEGKGIATQMAGRLVEISVKAAPHLIIAAQTLPKEGPSTKILRKLGFKNVGTIHHPEDGPVWEWHLVQQGAAADATSQRPRG